MVCMVTAHSTKLGKEDIYEQFLRQRKLWFVRNLPGITSYKVYRTERRFDPSGLASPDIEDDPALYIAHEVPESNQLSREEYAGLEGEQ
ncbi:hypothetical protein MNBD_GAMMA17-1766 [hydrothermal vent metagenome]|uniref:Uncharacterized protein n=1 Tax=hydrothermal vent metagenome TaxID=652676 RepID=A0A3B0Z822_9ZZZZ